MKTDLKRSTLFSAFAGALLCLSCSSPTQLAGGGTRGGNPAIAGAIVRHDGTPAANVKVFLVPQSYDPVMSGPLPDSLTSYTTPAGRYEFDDISSGTYNVFAIDNSEHKRLLIRNIAVARTDVSVPQDTLRIPGTVKILVSGSMDTLNGYLFIPGTVVSAAISASTGFVEMDSVPPQTLPGISYGVKNSTTQPRTIADSFVLAPGGLVIISYAEWKYSAKLSLNTTASGAGLSENLYGFPLLVRLTGGLFNFSEAAGNGSDIRFTKPDNSPVPFEIEQWDEQTRTAVIWVRLDTVYANTSRQVLTMYWGAVPALTTSKAGNAPVFDTASGFQGVWHLSEPQGSAARDATPNRFNGTPSDTAPAPVAGAIGTGQHFNGKNSFFTITGTASGRLNFPARSAYSLSAWVYTDTLDSMWQNIIAKGNTEYHLQIEYTNRWLFTEYEDHLGWEVCTAPATAKQWFLVTGVRDGDRQYLYVNGNCVDSVKTLNTFTDSLRYQGNPVTIGCATRKDPQLEYFFNGTIDEARMQNLALSPDWIKLCYETQAPGTNPVIFQRNLKKASRQ
jgi:hypothetical protein